jgi:hypothetical protein
MNIVFVTILAIERARTNVSVAIGQMKSLTAPSGVFASLVAGPEFHETDIVIYSSVPESTYIDVLYSGDNIKSLFISDSQSKRWNMQFTDGKLNPEDIKIKFILHDKMYSYKLVEVQSD